MAYTLSFESLHKYDLKESGIDVPVELRLGSNEIRLAAKLDTGASLCIFQRAYGESLGLNIESGLEQEVGTANSTFVTYGHEITLACLDLEVNLVAYFAKEHTIKRNVLGREGWLNRIRVGLIDHDGELYVNTYG